MCDRVPSFCPNFHGAVELIGRRWTGVILRALLQGATRFSDVAATVPALSDRMLAERLKELEAEGIVTRTVVPETPVRVEYGLTSKGRALEAVVEAVSHWADAWHVRAERPRAARGTAGACSAPEDGCADACAEAGS
ncbi:MAG TPA: helix-turn-helix domain-containing protein [Gemmatirosa sp.]